MCKNLLNRVMIAFQNGHVFNNTEFEKEEIHLHVTRDIINPIESKNLWKMHPRSQKDPIRGYTTKLMQNESHL